MLIISKPTGYTFKTIPKSQQKENAKLSKAKAEVKENNPKQSSNNLKKIAGKSKIVICYYLNTFNFYYF